MRRHGLSSFPDPSHAATARLAIREASGLGAPGTGFPTAFGSPGSFIVIPQDLIDSPAFKQAAVTCGWPGALQ